MEYRYTFPPGVHRSFNFVQIMSVYLRDLRDYWGEKGKQMERREICWRERENEDSIKTDRQVNRQRYCM